MCMPSVWQVGRHDVPLHMPFFILAHSFVAAAAQQELFIDRQSFVRCLKLGIAGNK